MEPPDTAVPYNPLEGNTDISLCIPDVPQASPQASPNGTVRFVEPEPLKEPQDGAEPKVYKPTLGTVLVRRVSSASPSLKLAQVPEAHCIC